jgi:Na+-transporting NADH:ubiquinone oxidoreductase subunit NqrD
MGRGTSFARGEEPEMLFADGGGGGTGVAVLVAVGIAVAAETV